ncbi:MAG: hypothetical protein ACYDCQ_11180 [Dehalococcoidia bacterium]
MTSRLRSAWPRVLAADAPLWVALLPAVAFVAAALQLALAAVDPDYWWHLATGRWMLDHGRVPFTDPFSYTHGGQTWYAHEWLSELALGIVDRIAGYSGGIVLTALIVAGGAWALGRAARYYGSTAFGALVLVCGSAFFVLGNLAVRPQVWGWALFCLLLHELAAHDTGRRASLRHVPLIFALWINVHLSALLGGAVFALYVGHRALRFCFARDAARICQRSRLRQAFWSAALSAAALCLNPRGPALLWFARAYANPHAVRYRYIGEWQRPTFSGDDRWLFVAGAAVVALIMLAMLWRCRLWPGVVALVLAAATLRAIRYGPLFAIAAVPAAGWLVGRFRGRTASLATRRVPRALGSTLTFAAVVAVIAGAAIRGPTQFRRHADPASGAYPVGAARWVQQNVLRPRLFNEYGWGGYLIAAFYPRRAVYMDGREEMYGETFFAQFVSTISAEPGWQSTLALAGVNATVIDPNGPLAQAMDNDPGWRRAYADKVAVVFVPSE